MRRTGRKAAISAAAVGSAVLAVLALGQGPSQVLGFSAKDVVGVAPALAGSTQFDFTGVIQSAGIGNNGGALTNDLQGGTVQVNGKTIIIPDNTVVILPASAMTWKELFKNAPAPYGPTQSGLALSDIPKPLTTYEINVIGNRVVSGASDRYIAGLVHISQEDLNAGSGYISFIDYSTGTIEVGGTPGTQGTGARVRINDPAVGASGPGQPGTGRYGVPFTADPRFQVDQDNPTIAAETGFPMCVPRTSPAVDPLCPESNRPNVSSPVVDTSGISPQPNTLVANEPYRLFRMDDPANVDNSPALCLRSPCADPRKQAPFEIGDYVTYSGNVMSDNVGQFIAAHTVIASVGIYTQPGKNPAYVSIEVSLIGTGGLTVFGAGEAAVRTRFEGMTTDETRLIRLYGVDINPVTGATSDREWGTVMPDLGPPTGAVRGRWRFRPPCTGTAQTVSDKLCTPPPAGQFIPPTREVRAVITGFSQFNPGTLDPNTASQIPGSPNATTSANGIYWGQYHAPIGEYIFPENVPGTAVPENNFNTIPFLAYGGYQSITGQQAGVLNPWPSNVAPSPVVCAAPTINGGPYAVANGATIQLSGSVTAGATTPVTVHWTAGTTPGGSDLAGALTGANTTTPSFNATGLAARTYNLTFTVSNVCGTSSATSTIVVGAAPAPTINAIQGQTVGAGSSVTITATSPSTPTPTWAWAAAAGNPAAVAFTQNPAAASQATTSSITFTAPATTGTYNFTVTATNVNGSSSVVTVPITVTAAKTTNITLQNVYRTQKQRLIITATSTDPTVTSMVLQPYLTETGTVFDPKTLGAGLVVSLITPGSFTIDMVGAPRPACNLGGNYVTPCAKSPIVVDSVGGAVQGTSGPTALTTIRT